MAITAIKSDHITNLATQPIAVPTAGEGAAGRVHAVQDVVAVTEADLATVGSTIRLARFPVHAKIDKVEIVYDAGIGTGASETLAYDVFVAFSDSKFDGTQDGVRGKAPHKNKDGTVADTTDATNANLLWGSITLSEAGGAADVTYNGAAATYPKSYTMAPLYGLFNFVDGRGNRSNPGGKFDVMLRLKTLPKTAGSGTILARVAWRE